MNIKELAEKVIAHELGASRGASKTLAKSVLIMHEALEEIILGDDHYGVAKEALAKVEELLK